ncbi:MAG: nicotinate-nucleotide adenylyltransferase [Pseudomonadota bacterium]
MTGNGFVKLPFYGAGQRIGLFGGSFNPAHAGHEHVALTALRRLQLDWLWVLVTPGNPLKSSPQQSVQKRMTVLRQQLHHPRIVVTDIEQQAGLRYTLDTIRFLKMRAPDANFVWVMGADNLKTFHAWQGWKKITQILPVCIVDREAGKFAAQNSKAAQHFASFRHAPEQAAALPYMDAPAWIFLHGRHIPFSSTALRNAARP